MLDDSEMLQDLEKVERGEFPSPFGEIQFDIDLEPISQGANSKHKKKLRSHIHKACSKYQFLLSGDVQIEIQWLVHQQYRYEYHKAPDIDNIIKPVLDSLCGKSGLIIDDTQVQYIGSHWIDWTKRDHKLTLTIKYSPDDFVSKEELVFVEFDRGLCLPFNLSLDNKAALLILTAWANMIEKRKELDTEGLDYYSSKMFLPIQRLFHRNKLSEYPIYKLADLVAQFQANK